MANTKSAARAARQSERHRLHNKYYAKTTRNAIRDLRNTTDKAAAQENAPKVYAMIDKLAKIRNGDVAIIGLESFFLGLNHLVPGLDKCLPRVSVPHFQSFNRSRQLPAGHCSLPSYAVQQNPATFYPVTGQQAGKRSVRTFHLHIGLKKLRWHKLNALLAGTSRKENTKKKQNDKPSTVQSNSPV